MKTIITLDKADQPFGFPQGNEQGFLTGSKVYGPYGNNSVVSASWAATASFAANANIPTGSFVTTASFNQFTASYNTGSFIGSFTGSLLGTASVSQNSVTASYVTGSIFTGSNLARSASFALTASTAINANFATSAGNASTSDNVNGYANATVDQINVGETSAGTYAYVVRAEELEQSKYSTINVFNFLNFT